MDQPREINTDQTYTIPLYIQIADRIMSQIESGDLPPGTQLAPERVLSSELSVNRMTLRRALQVLESQGLLPAMQKVRPRCGNEEDDEEGQGQF